MIAGIVRPIQALMFKCCMASPGAGREASRELGDLTSTTISFLDMIFEDCSLVDVSLELCMGIVLKIYQKRYFAGNNFIIALSRRAVLYFFSLSISPFPFFLRLNHDSFERIR